MAVGHRSSYARPLGAAAPWTLPLGRRRPAVPTSAVTVDVVEGTAGWARLRDEWQALYRRVDAEPSVSYDWTRAVADHWLEPGDDVRTVVLRRGPRVLGVVPLLARAGARAYRHLTPLAEQFTTHSDWLVAEASPAVAEAFVDGLLALDVPWDRFRMSRVPDAHPFLPLVCAALARRGPACALRSAPASYHLALPASYDAYLAARSAKFRNYLRRVEKRLARLSLSVRVVGTASAADVDRQFDDALAIERASWKQADGLAISADARTAAYWRALCQQARADGQLHLQVLHVDQQPVAYNLGFLRHGRYSYLKTTTRSECRSLGAPTFLRARLVDDLIARGATAIDFTGEPGDWEHQWTHDRRPRSMLTVFAATPRGRLLHWYERLRYRGVAMPEALVPDDLPTSEA